MKKIIYLLFLLCFVLTSCTYSEMDKFSRDANGTFSETGFLGVLVFLWTIFIAVPNILAFFASGEYNENGEIIANNEYKGDIWRNFMFIFFIFIYAWILLTRNVGLINFTSHSNLNFFLQFIGIPGLIVIGIYYFADYFEVQLNLITKYTSYAGTFCLGGFILFLIVKYAIILLFN